MREDVREIKDALNNLVSTLTNLRVDFARVDERIKHVPTYWESVRLIGTIVALGSALVIFQNQIRSVLGLG